MQNSFDELQFLVGNAGILSRMADMPTLPMFSEEAVSFLAALSRELLRNERTRAYVDVTSYAYWIRKASLEAVKAKHRDYNNRLGRGLAFHLAPSNVPVNFAVSMTSSVLAGNCTLIRVSNRPFVQVDLICEAINHLLQTEFSQLKPYFCIVRYVHSDEMTRQLSAICDLRVIWGGDRTIETIRKAPIPPRAIEMTFADRHSIAIIQAEEYMKQDAEAVAKGFYTDTYYTDQNACSSPRLVVWLGECVNEARERFWDSLREVVEKEYEMKPIQAVDKYTSACLLGMRQKGQKLVSKDNKIVRIEVKKLSSELMNYKNGGGYFFEYMALELSEIIPVLTKQCQTISLLGIEKEEVKRLIFRTGVRGVDRIVPLGQTMGLEFIWDGYKMIEAMSRFVYTGVYE